jgi:hypothetical protein
MNAAPLFNSVVAALAEARLEAILRITLREKAQ